MDPLRRRRRKRRRRRRTTPQIAVASSSFPCGIAAQNAVWPSPAPNDVPPQVPLASPAASAVEGSSFAGLSIADPLPFYQRYLEVSLAPLERPQPASPAAADPALLFLPSSTHYQRRTSVRNLLEYSSSSWSSLLRNLTKDN